MRTLLAAVLLFAALPLQATVMWSRTVYGTPSATVQPAYPGSVNPAAPEGQKAIARDPVDDSVVIVGNGSNGTNLDWRVAKYGVGGRLHWEKAVNGFYGDDGAVAVKLDAAGNAVVAGWMRNAAGNDDIHVVKYSRYGGIVMWQRTIDSPSQGHDRAAALELDGSGNVFIAGTRLETDKNWTILKLSGADGSVLWQAAYDTGYGNDEAKALVVDDAGNAYVGLVVSNSFGFQDKRVVKVNGANGSVAWTHTDLVNDVRSDFLHAMALAHDGSIYVAGSRDNGAYHDGFVYELDAATGTRTWGRVIYDLYGETATTSIVRLGSDVIAATYLRDSSGSNDIHVRRLSGVNGAEVWSYQRMAPLAWDAPWALHTDGTTIGVVGYRNGDAALIRLDAAGALESETILAGTAGQFDEGQAVIVDGPRSWVLARTRDAGLPDAMRLVKYDERVTFGGSLFLTTSAPYPWTRNVAYPFTINEGISGLDTVNGRWRFRINGIAVLEQGAGTLTAMLTPTELGENHITVEYFETDQNKAPLISNELTPSVIETWAASVTMTGSPSGGTVVTSSPAGISCPPDCSEAFDNTDYPVTLSVAVSRYDWFRDWTTGPCSGNTTTPCVLPGGGNVTQAARFVRRNVIASEASWTFPQRGIGFPPVRKSIDLVNEATGPRTIAIAVAGAHPGDFTMSTTCGASLGASATCTVHVDFSPTALGARSAQLVLTTDQPIVAPTVIALSGTGANIARVQLSATATDFGYWGAGQSVPIQVVTMTNIGTGLLVLSSVTIAPPFTIVSLSCDTFVSVGQSCTAIVRYTPTNPDDVRDFTVASNEPDGPSTLQLVGHLAQVPETLVGTGPSGVVASREAQFTFSSNLAYATFQCRLDSEPFAACTSPIAYSALADGPHAFEVRAVTNAGPDASPVVHGWTVSLPVAPSLRRPRDANGDGRSDVFWDDPNGQAAVWLMDGVTPIGSALLLGPSTGWTMENVVGDYNGDGRADIIWKHDSGMWAIWLMDGTAPSSYSIVLGPSTGWSVSHVGDFDGDGSSDLLWRHTDGSVSMWLMNGLSVANSTILFGPGTPWSVTHVADLDGDARSDLVWRNSGDGSVSGWLMNGLSVANSGFVFGGGTTWQVIHAGDFDGDGRKDLLFRDADGQLSVFLMNGLAVVNSGIVYNGGAFEVTHVADFNGDARSDLLFKDAGGQVAVWLLDGFSVAGSALIFGGGGGWMVTHTGDYNGDGRYDLLWKDSGGQVAIWMLDGTAVTGSALIFGGNGGWIAAP